MNDPRTASSPMPATQPTETLAVRGGALSLLLLAAGAQAQSPNCDRLKTTLAARMDASGVHGYALQTVPAKTANPPGSKVIGTCDGGAMKVLYRRGGGAAPAPEAADTTTPAESTAAAALQAPPPAPAPKPAPVPAPPTAAVVLAAAADVPAPAPAPAPLPTPAPAPAPEAMASAAMSTAAPASAPAAAAPASSDGEKGNGPPFTGRVRAYLADGPHWAWGLVLLPLLAWLWAWQRHRSLYDEAGLPRGPKL